MKSGTAKVFLQSGMVIENCQFATYNNIIKLNLPGIINFINRDTDFLNNKNRFILVIIRNSIISLYMHFLNNKKCILIFLLLINVLQYITTTYIQQYFIYRTYHNTLLLTFNIRFISVFI